MKRIGLFLGVFGIPILIMGLIGYYSYAQCITLDKNFRVTVMVDTPEGVKTGSAIRNISNKSCKGRLKWPQSGNPADVTGEAVVIDLGDRGTLFALISHESDSEFYQVFANNASGVTTYDGIKKYYDLPAGKKGVLDPERYPSYPRLVTFTDMDNPKSVTLAQVWGRQADGHFYLKDDRMEELFGEGVHLKAITLEITDEPVTNTNILDMLPDFNDEYWRWVKTLKYGDPKLISKVNFKGKF